MKFYTLCCHGCGKIHDVQAYFLAVPAYIGVDGKDYGIHGCNECLQDGDRIKRAWQALNNGTFEEFKKEHWNEV